MPEGVRKKYSRSNPRLTARKTVRSIARDASGRSTLRGMRTKLFWEQSLKEIKRTPIKHKNYVRFVTLLLC